MVPYWKKLWSYVSEVHIESTSSVYNPHLYVSMNYGRFMLSTDKAIYSYADKYDNFGSVFKQLELGSIKNCLILGFGLGSIPYILEKKHHLNISYTGIEIDDEVIYLASKYALPELESEIHLIQADASSFIELDTHRYDLIAMDIFESDYIPHRFETTEYLETVKGMLSNNGLLLYNRLAYTEEDNRRSTFFFENTFSKVFPESVKIPVKGNLMLINTQSNIKKSATSR